MIAKQKVWMKKVTSLMDYMHYNWEGDEKWKAYRDSKNKKTSVKDLKDFKREEEQMKRAYYST